MRFGEFRRLVASDLFRHAGRVDHRAFWYFFMLSPGFRYIFWLRLASWMGQAGFVTRHLQYLSELVLRHYSIKYGMSIPHVTKIGPGFYIGHFGGIVVSGRCTIGRDCNISQGVTIGQVNRGPRMGTPVIGDRVYFGPGAAVLGAVKVGSDVAIGANAVVLEDIPDHAVAVGVPARVVSLEGSEGYVENTGF